MKESIRIGTRGSPLALYQAELVKTCIQRDLPLLPVEIIKIKTGGDMIRHGVDHPFETKRIYTREIEEALLQGEVDVAVHSAKDMAVVLPAGLKISAAFEREDSRDCLISRDGKKVSELPLGARVGTSSLRRKTQLLRLHPELIIEEVHGNVGTRIQRVDEGSFDATVLALAGVKRLGLTNRVTEIFDPHHFYPAPGQGIIAAEIRENDGEMDEILKSLNHQPTTKQLECERAFLRKLQGGCQLPCGIHTEIHGGILKAWAILLNTEAREWVEVAQDGTVETSESLGETLAGTILARGGKEIIEKIKRSLADQE